MDKLQSYVRARKVSCPTLVIVAVVFLLAGMLVAWSTGCDQDSPGRASSSGQHQYTVFCRPC